MSSVDYLREHIWAGVPEEYVKLGLELAERWGLDPTLGHLQLIPRRRRSKEGPKGTTTYEVTWNPYITRDGLLHIAHSSGQFDGISVELQVREDDIVARATVWRRDMSHPFVYEVYMSEYRPNRPDDSSPWKTHPKAMLTKVAEVFALRRAFAVGLTAVEELSTIEGEWMAANGRDTYKKEGGENVSSNRAGPQSTITAVHSPKDSVEPEEGPEKEEKEEGPGPDTTEAPSGSPKASRVSVAPTPEKPGSSSTTDVDLSEAAVSDKIREIATAMAESTEKGYALLREYVNSLPVRAQEYLRGACGPLIEEGGSALDWLTVPLHLRQAIRISLNEKANASSPDQSGEQGSGSQSRPRKSSG